MKKTLTKLEIKGIREEAINWLVNKRHSFTLLKDQKRTMLNQWNNPNNASVRVMYFGILIEIKRLKKLSNTELFYELEYTHKESIYVTKAIKTYSQEAESRLAKDLLDKLKLAKITKGRPEGAYKKNTI